jgi:predicted AlkP superfamily pyrophosphatase or phosphodiesterase
MKNSPLWILFLLSGILTTRLGAQTPRKDRHVVLISLDGFPAAMWRDPALPAPNLRRLAAEGAQTEAMTVSNPSITWINHTTLVTGVNPRRHGVLFNGLLTRGEGGVPKIEQWAEKDRMVQAPTLYDVAHEAGLTTAESDWVAVTKAKTIDWSFPELPSLEGKVEREMIAEGAFREEEVQWMQFGPGRKNVAWLDEAWTRAARFILERHRPNLLLYHTLNSDAVHHTYGAGTMASYTALAYADRLVGDVLQSLDKSGLRESTTVVVATDHGFKKVSKVVYPNVLLRDAGLLRTKGTNVVEWDAYCMPQGGMSFVYVRDAKRRAELLPRLKALFQKSEGIERVIDGEDGPSLGMPTPSENAGMGDLVLYAKNGYAFKAGNVGEEAVAPSTGYLGTHGYLNTDSELDGICIFSGNGIRKGVVVNRMSNLDVAPTVAKILGLRLPKTEGRILEEFLCPVP